MVEAQKTQKRTPEEIQQVKEQKLAERLQRKEENRHRKVQSTVNKYKHADPNSLTNKGGKWYATIKCSTCGTPRTVQVQDLFHVNKCTTCKANENKKEKPQKT